MSTRGKDLNKKERIIVSVGASSPVVCNKKQAEMVAAFAA